MSEALEIPPPPESLDSIEEYSQGQHPEGELRIRIEFYRDGQGQFFVWPYIRELRGDSDALKHFMVLGHFVSKDEARSVALNRGQQLIAAGFDVHSVD